MGAIDDRLEELDIELPAPPAPPPGVVLPFELVRVHGRHARSAIGAGELPFGMTVEVEALVAIR